MTQAEALDILKMGHNVFITGAAGSGKTHTLRAYIDYLNKSNASVAITASTGIAATHIGGSTIHSWSGLGVRDSLSEQDLSEMEERQYLWRRYDQVRILIIDEVSMLHHFRFDLLDKICRFFKRNDAPFGGMQIVLCGDFFQLPPVTIMGEPEASFIHKSDVWEEMNLKICYLSEQHRQNIEDEYFKILNEIRGNDVGTDTYELLQSRLNQESESKIPPTRLYTHNIDVDAVNNRELGKIAGEAKIYAMSSKGRAAIVETLKKSCLSPEKLSLKIGAKVMFVKNNFEKHYVNGTLGIVVAYDSAGYPIVETLSGKRILATPESWMIEEEGKIKAEINQVPLRLAWAITVHKSQGMSLDAAEMDLSKSFIKGMGYVALSRVRSLKGLKLLGINQMALRVDEGVFEYDQTLRSLSKQSQSELKKMTASEMKKEQGEFLAKVAGSKKIKEEKIATHHKTKNLLLQKLSLEEMAEARGMTTETIVSHIEKLLEEDPSFDVQYLFNANFTDERFQKIEKAFEKSLAKNGDYRLAPVRGLLGPDFDYLELRIARLFLGK